MEVHHYSLEQVLDELNKGKRWKVGYLLLSISVMFPASWNFNSIYFTASTPAHHCKIPANKNLSESVPFRNGKPLQCKQYKNFIRGTKVIDCVNGWTYTDKDLITIVTEFNLVCKKSSSVTLLIVVFLIGRGIGSNIFPQMADNFGRKKILILAQFMLAIFGVSTIFCDSMPILCVVRLITGACQQGVMLVGIVLVMEHFSSNYRTSVGITISYIWAIGHLVLCLMAYYIKDWIFLQCSINLLPLIIMPLYQVVPESFVWLMANERVEKVQKRLLDYCKRSRNIPPRFLLVDVLNVEDGDFRTKTHYRVTSVCQSKTMSKIFTTIIFLWWQLYLIYVVLDLSTKNFFQSVYARLLVYASAEFTGYSLSYVSLKKFGRRHSVVIMQWLTTTSLFGFFLLHVSKHSYYSSIFSFLARTGVNATLAVGYIYTMELFPTNLRLQAMGFIIKFSGLSNFLAPAFSVIAVDHPWAVVSVCGSLMLICSIAIYGLPETSRKPLPQTFSTIISWMPKKKRKKKITENV